MSSAWCAGGHKHCSCMGPNGRLTGTPLFQRVMHTTIALVPVGSHARGMLLLLQANAVDGSAPLRGRACQQHEVQGRVQRCQCPCRQLLGLLLVRCRCWSCCCKVWVGRAELLQQLWRVCAAAGSCGIWLLLVICWVFCISNCIAYQHVQAAVLGARSFFELWRPRLLRVSHSAFLGLWGDG